MVIVNFIRDKEVGLFARAKRLPKAKPLVEERKDKAEEQAR
jgi:hypothetical protein